MFGSTHTGANGDTSQTFIGAGRIGRADREIERPSAFNANKPDPSARATLNNGRFAGIVKKAHDWEGVKWRSPEGKGGMSSHIRAQWLCLTQSSQLPGSLTTGTRALKRGLGACPALVSLREAIASRVRI